MSGRPVALSWEPWQMSSQTKNTMALLATAAALLVFASLIKTAPEGSTERTVAVVVETVLIVIAVALGFRMYLIASRNAGRGKRG
jgi:ABC-type tungstate transport system substrate-binding protein